MADDTSALFPTLTRDYILAFQFSSWYPLFAAHSIKSTIIRPLSAEFSEYLHADGVFVPEGSEDAPADSTLSDDEQDSDGDGDSDDENTRRKHFAFPELDARIRDCVKAYDAVFPKLNFTSPRDASWLLPASSPLKCTSPADVYLLLKSSDFVTHDLNPEAVFEGTMDAGAGVASSSGQATSTATPASASAAAETDTDTESRAYELELVLRKWYPVDRSRELRCFVRDDVLIAISQRDTNFYEFWNERATQDRVRTAVRAFWETHIRPRWPREVAKDYIFDFLLTRDLARGHIIDFNPYAPKTDPLLFSYEELAELRRPCPGPDPGPVPGPGARGPKKDGAGDQKDSVSSGADGASDAAQEGQARQEQQQEGQEGKATTDTGAGEGEGGPAQGTAHEPVLRVIDSAAHPAATSNAPANQHNMVPFEAISLSSGRDIEEFAAKWDETVKESMQDN